MYLSLNVQSNVSLSQHANSESTQPVKRSKPPIGRYLVRSGNILLFQMRLLPLAHKTLVQGYVAIVKTVITSGQTNYNYPNPIANAKLSYPDTVRPSVSVEPLSP